MPTRYRRALIGLALWLPAAFAPAAEPEILVPLGAAWRYHDSGADLGDAWRAPDYDDRDWSRGPAPLGYGEDYIVTRLDSGPAGGPRPLTCYFRTDFQCEAIPPETRLLARVRYDDAFALYLNGKPLLKRGLPDNPTATTAGEGHEGDVLETFGPLPVDALQVGRNVLAAEVHQSSPTSSDLVFDLELSLVVPEPAFVVAPVVQNPTPTSVTLVWETPEALPGLVEYGPADGADYPSAARVDTPATIQKVTVTGLTPDTTYRYRVRYRTATAEATFRTAPAGPRPVRFAALGDSRFWGTAWQDNGFPAHCLAQAPEFIVHLGDFVNDGRQAELWPAHFERFAATNRSLAMYGVRGNHERSAAEAGERDYFAKYHVLPGGEPYSSFDWGDVHVAILSYPLVRQGLDWLDADLAATDRPWKIVAFHEPIWCTGYDRPDDSRKVAGAMPEMDRILERRGVDLVLLGHTHTYERTWGLWEGARDDRRGVVHVMTAGALQSGFPDWFTATTVIDADYDLPHYAVIDIRDGRLELRAFALREGTRGAEAVIDEVDHFVRWRDEALPRASLAELESPDEAVRLAAIERLGAMVYHPAVPALVARLAAGSPVEQRAVVTALRRIGDPGAAEALFAQLSHADPAVRREAARAIEIAMPPALAPRVATAALDDTQDPRGRSSLLGALRFHSPETAREVAPRLLDHPEPWVRNRAAEVYKRVATTADLERLVATFIASDHSYVTVSMAWGLNRLTGKSVSLTRAGQVPKAEREEFARQWRE